LDDIDRRILEYAACHPVLLVSQMRSLLDVQEPVATERLDSLVAAGLIRHGLRLRHQRAGYQITGLGLREIGSELPVPRVDLRRYWHDVGVAWMWLAARKGRLGEVERVYCEREMRAADQKPAVQASTIDPTMRSPDPGRRGDERHRPRRGALVAQGG
jgi:DNA-binding Lrp family transcriptional regulator